MHSSPALRLLPQILDSEAREAFEFAALADAKNTQRTYLSDWKHYLIWCKRRNKMPLPGHPDNVALYIRFCAENLKLK